MKQTGLEGKVCRERIDLDLVDQTLVKLLAAWDRLPESDKDYIYKLVRQQSWRRKGWYLTQKICPPEKR
jgi:hypothetical protein